MDHEPASPEASLYQRLVADHPWWLSAAALLLAVALTAGLHFWGPGESLTIVGFTATIAALLLTVFIYTATARDSSRLLDRIDALEQQLSDATEDPDRVRQTPEQLDEAITKYRDYINALLAEYPMPERALIDIDRPGEGKGNRPVLVQTEKGRRYSIWKGGRGGGFTVTRLPPATEA